MKKISSPEKQSGKRLTPGMIALIYAVIGGLWILASDSIVHMMSKDPEMITRLQTYKGWFYIGLTAAILYWLVRRHGDAYRRSEERFRAIFDNASDGILLADAENKRFHHANEMICKMLGYSLEEIKRLGVSDIHPAKDLPFVVDQFERQSRGEFTLARDIPMKRKDGSVFYADINSTPVTLSGKKYLMGFFRDVTERKKAEQLLQFLTLRYEAILASVPDIIMEVDNNKVYTWANKAGVEFFGNDVIGKEAAFYFEGEQKTYETVQPLFEGSEDTIYLESWQRRRDGEKRLLAWWCRVLKDSSCNVAGALSSARDITEHNQAEDALRRGESILAQAGAMARLGTWTIDISNHDDLNANPLRWSDETYRIFGYEPGGVEVTNELFFERVHPEDRQKIVDSVAKAIADKGPYSIEHRVIRPDGTEIIVWEHAEITFDEQGRPITMIGAVQDITERKAAIEEIRTRAHQQEAVARLGKRALSGISLDDLLNETVINVAEVLNVEYCKVLELSSDGRFLLRSGVGWNEGLVGSAMVEAGANSQAGYTLLSKEPVVVEDLQKEARFSGPPLLRDHAVVSGMSVIIGSMERPYGVFGAHTSRRRTFSKDAIHFIQAVSNMLAEAIERKKAEDELEERARQATLGADVGAALVQNSDLRSLLQICAQSIVDNLGAAFARIWTLNERDDVLELQASAGMYTHLNGPHGRVPVGKFKIGMIAQEKKPHLTNAVIDDPHISDQEWARREGMVAFAGHPLVVGDKLVGVMALFSKKPLQESTLTALASIADEIAVGIERIRVDAALRDSERNYRTLVDNALVGVYRSIIDGKFLYVNDAMARMFGCASPEEVLSEGALTRYKSPTDREPLLEKLKRDGNVGNYEVVLPTKTGDQINALISATLHGDTISGMVLDITGYKKLEEQLRQAQKIEAIGLLAGGVAHDFNNILSAIIGYAHLTLMKMQEDDPLRHNLEQILESCNRAAVLTQGLLAFSRKQPVNLSVIDLNEVIRGFSKFLLRLIREDIVLKALYVGENLSVLADRGQIEQVIMNLVTNARDAMPNGGKLVIETKRATVNREFIELHGYGKEGEYALVSVSDTGIGMDEQTRSRIFEPFFTTKEQGKGTGLGLSMVYGTVKKHDGFINVYSEPGNGTTFKIYLPLARAAAKADHAKIGEPNELRGGTETILIAEDDAPMRDLTLAALKQFGYTVIEAIDGADAVVRFKESREKIQLIILDGIMPRMNGKEAFREIKAMSPDIKCIFMSGYAEDIFTKDGVPDGEAEFILKPIAPSDLLKKIREVLDK